MTFYWSHHILAFSAVNLAFNCFCWIALSNFSSFFCFPAFREFQCHFYKSTFILTFIMGIFYFILICWGLKLIKLKKCFFSTHLQQICKQNNTLMQLRSIFCKTLIKIIWKSHNFKIIDLVTFQQLRRLWKGGGRKFALYLPLLLSVHKNLQYELNSHTSLFIVIFYFFSYIALFIFLDLQFHCSLIFLYKYNEYM